MASGVTTIGRDYFARFDIIRQQVRNLIGGCDWCGGVSAKGKLYRYGIDTDGIAPGRQQWSKGKFCSRGCCKSYHGD